MLFLNLKLSTTLHLSTREVIEKSLETSLFIFKSKHCLKIPRLINLSNMYILFETKTLQLILQIKCYNAPSNFATFVLPKNGKQSN